MRDDRRQCVAFGTGADGLGHLEPMRQIGLKQHALQNAAQQRRRRPLRPRAHGGGHGRARYRQQRIHFGFAQAGELGQAAAQQRCQHRRGDLSQQRLGRIDQRRTAFG